MRGPDIIDKIWISPGAWAGWQFLAQAAAGDLSAALMAEAIPDEAAEVLPDGGLRIYVDLPPPHPGLELEIPPGQWGFLARPQASAN